MTKVIPFPMPHPKALKPKRRQLAPGIKEYLTPFLEDIKAGQLSTFCVLWITPDGDERRAYILDGCSNSALLGLMEQAKVEMIAGVTEE